MADDRLNEIIERLARIEENVTYMKSATDKNSDLISRHETDIQRAKGVILFLGVLTSLISIKSLLK